MSNALGKLKRAEVRTVVDENAKGRGRTPQIELDVYEPKGRRYFTIRLTQAEFNKAAARAAE